MSDIEDLRKAVGAAAVVTAYMHAHREMWPPETRLHAYNTWYVLEATLTRREKEVRGEEGTD
jgi:hypothetical protein